MICCLNEFFFSDEYGFAFDINEDEDLEEIMSETEGERYLYVMYNDEIENSRSECFPSQYFCNFCGYALEFFRYKCQECPDYDICERCFEDGIHKEHQIDLENIESALSTTVVSKI